MAEVKSPRDSSSHVTKRQKKEYKFYFDPKNPDFQTFSGEEMDRDEYEQYRRDIENSGGFDISVFPGSSPNSFILPMRYLDNPKRKQRYIELCNEAVRTFNSEGATNYEFVEIVTVNASYAAGVLYYFTFKAKDTNAADVVGTFQAKVFDEVGGGIVVKLCRLKTTSPSDKA